MLPPVRNRACRTEFGNFSQRSYQLSQLFSPTLGGGAQSKRTMPAQCNWNITNQHQNGHDNDTNNLRPRKCQLLRQGTDAEQADHAAAKTTVHQQNHCSSTT